MSAGAPGDRALTRFSSVPRVPGWRVPAPSLMPPGLQSGPPSRITGINPHGLPACCNRARAVPMSGLKTSPFSQYFCAILSPRLMSLFFPFNPIHRNIGIQQQVRLLWPFQVHSGWCPGYGRVLVPVQESGPHWRLPSTNTDLTHKSYSHIQAVQICANS